MTTNEPLEMIQCSCKTKIESVEGEYFMHANTGQPMRLENYRVPVVIDMNGAEFEKDPSPVLYYHDSALPIGVTTGQAVVPFGASGCLGKRDLKAAGIYNTWKITNSGSIAAEVKENIENGFPYEVSVGARPLEMVKVGEGETYSVNGYDLVGPAMVATKSRICEVSICVFGACPGTKNLKASREGQKAGTMENVIENTPDVSPVENQQGQTATIQATASTPTGPTEAEIKAKLEKEAEDTRRLSIDTIAKCANIQANARVTIDDAEFKTINAAKNYALKNGITADAFQKAVIEASINRPVGPMIHASASGECKRSAIASKGAGMLFGACRGPNDVKTMKSVAERKMGEMRRAGLEEAQFNEVRNRLIERKAIRAVELNGVSRVSLQSLFDYVANGEKARGIVNSGDEA